MTKNLGSSLPPGVFVAAAARSQPRPPCSECSVPLPRGPPVASLPLPSPERVGMADTLGFHKSLTAAHGRNQAEAARATRVSQEFGIKVFRHGKHGWLLTAFNMAEVTQILRWVCALSSIPPPPAGGGAHRSGIFTVREAREKGLAFAAGGL